METKAAPISNTRNSLFTEGFDLKFSGTKGLNLEYSSNLADSSGRGLTEMYQGSFELKEENILHKKETHKRNVTTKQESAEDTIEGTILEVEENEITCDFVLQDQSNTTIVLSPGIFPVSDKVVIGAKVRLTITKKSGYKTPIVEVFESEFGDTPEHREAQKIFDEVFSDK